MFEINPSQADPIWRQIEEGIRRMIALGSLGPGDAVPSVRDLAATVRVNPNTVARAYQRLTDAGVLVVKRGEGTYVADVPSQPKKNERAGMLREAATRYASAAISIGVSEAEAVEELVRSYERLAREHGRKS